MKTNEFRIGNWVKIPTKRSEIIIPSFEAQIQSIGLFGMIKFLNTPEKEGESWSVKSISPIPLTNQWLKDFGFEKENYYWENGKVKIINNDDYFIFHINNWEWVKIEYVHQLQNLFFALTGEELTKSSKITNAEK